MQNSLIQMIEIKFIDLEGLLIFKIAEIEDFQV